MRPIEILLVEDNPGDVRLTQEALGEAKVRNNLAVARDGVEALAYLRRETPFEDAVRPDLVLLDLNLPRKDGREVLAEIKQDPEFAAVAGGRADHLDRGEGYPGKLQPVRQLLHQQAGRSRTVRRNRVIHRGLSG